MPWDTMFSSSRTFLVLIVLLRNCTGWMMIWFFRTFLIPSYTKKTNLPKDLHGSVCGGKVVYAFFSLAWIELCCSEFAYHRHSRNYSKPEKKTYKRARQSSSSLPSALLILLPDHPTTFMGGRRCRKMTGGGVVVIVTMYCARKIQNIQ